MKLPNVRIVAMLVFIVVFSSGTEAQQPGYENFNQGWQFFLGEKPPAFGSSMWRRLDLPHDWSIELPFEANSPTGTGGGALRGGLGWYRKKFSLKQVPGVRTEIIFEGVYCNSEVWINGQLAGKRPNGYISFAYDLTKHLFRDEGENELLVRVDNARQPNSRWYSGSGIYRDVWLHRSTDVHIPYNTVIVTPADVTDTQASLHTRFDLQNHTAFTKSVLIDISIVDPEGKQLPLIAPKKTTIPANNRYTFETSIPVTNPVRWSVDNPALYRVHIKIRDGAKIIEQYTVRTGIRTFHFDVKQGFFVNGKKVKIRGVCNHHDLGALGTAVYPSALRRQLQLLKDMGCNGIRTSHNPPAPALLDLCDEMGFIVMNEAFDMWKKQKSTYDYHLDWNEWHERDLRDLVMRDRNHPSVFMWSVGNEIGEQWAEENDTASANILPRLARIVKAIDSTRPVLTANNEIGKRNRLLLSGADDVTGYNYNHASWDSVLYTWPGKPFVVTESVSALQTRGHYDMPSDSIRRWPIRWDIPLTTGNKDLTCSAYDNCSTPWGSTHEETLHEFEKYDHISGMYIWTGFDYLGEPTPYPWPARSSYFGIIDLAGFPKDVYYLYQSVWTDRPVLHLFPHWNWEPGQQIDMWAYYNQADEAELFVNGQSQGIKRKVKDELHVRWNVVYQPGIVKIVSRKNGREVLVKEIATAGPPASIKLKNTTVERGDLLFIEVNVNDANDRMVSTADNLIQFSVEGGKILATDNGLQTDLRSFQSHERNLFSGKCILIVKPQNKSVRIHAQSEGLKDAKLLIDTK